ncbi:MAG: heat-inducible transcription repressor HrcA [Clostridia bacterium]|nr:heat-inducible transcription repressor HrcA [Clostridia bacterium]
MKGTILNNRTLEILKAIVDEYVSTAEPIGSKNLLSRYDFGVSSATIRNEMSQLESEGFISQPYTSAGRIPSEKGYRFYVDNLFKEISQKHYMMELIDRIEALSQIDKIIEDISNTLYERTNYTAIGIRKRDLIKNKILAIHLLEMKILEYVAVIILENRKVEHREFKVRKDCTIDIERITNYLNKMTKGKTASEIIDQEYQELYSFTEDDAKFTRLVLKEIFDILKQNDDFDMYIKGKEKLLEYPEFKNADDARMLMEAFSKKQKLIDMLDEAENDGINIKIGKENSNSDMENLSIVKKTMDMGEYGYITIALAGPTRMNYKKVIHSFTDLGKLIDDLLKKY